jgi:S-adenosylmethionine-diacylgycerolhomoserine-N-methlytransferase
MSLADAQVLFSLLRGQPTGGDHADRLTAFYAPQAAHYDRFRERLLHGRRELYAQLPLPPGAHIAELGAGTGRNLAFLGDRVQRLERAWLVDLCPPLLDVAQRRWMGHRNVRVVEGDACHWRPDGPLDAVVFSYALTMIPDWSAALDNALAMLKPEGRLAIVDFTLAPDQGMIARSFWRRWFAHDGVHLDPRHPQRLAQRLPDHALSFHRAPVPYLPGLRTAHYRFIGRMPPVTLANRCGNETVT